MYSKLVLKEEPKIDIKSDTLRILAFQLLQTLKAYDSKTLSKLEEDLPYIY